MGRFCYYRHIHIAMEATMELKSFVTQALVEIVEGVQDAQYFTSYPAGHITRYCKRDFITS
jgi:hypothetical protein